MAKQKSRFIAFTLAVFTGPLSFIYVGKWKRALVLFSLLWIPWINLIVFLYALFAIIPNVKAHNRNLNDNMRYGIIVCNCRTSNRAWSKFCSGCGAKLVKQCDYCEHYDNKFNKFCSNCGQQFGRLLKKEIELRETQAVY